MARDAHRFARLRSINPVAVDAAIAAGLAIVSIGAVFGQDIRDEGQLVEGFHEPTGLAVATALVTCAPIAVRRRWPVPALTVAAASILLHFGKGFPEGTLPIAVLILTYTVGSRCTLRSSLVGLAVVLATIVAIGVVSDAPALDSFGVVGILTQYTSAWAFGVAMRSRRAAAEALVREAEERAEAERQTAARVLAEQRLLIAQELHDVVAHSMSVIAVQAGVGAHVLAERPAEAQTALDAISTTSRSTLAELRRLLGVLRDADGSRSHEPAPTLQDIPRLVDDVRAAGVPVTLHVDGSPSAVHSAVELSAYRVVQEALTNVIKHAGEPSRVEVSIRHRPGSLTIEVIDDGRGLAARSNGSGTPIAGSGHGLVGMRERVEVWGGELTTGPARGGGYRVVAHLPYGEPR